MNLSVLLKNHDYFSNLRDEINSLENRYKDNPQKVALRLIVKNFVFLLLNKDRSNLNKDRSNIKKIDYSDPVFIELEFSGGYGDYIISMNWFYHFYEFYKNENIVYIIKGKESLLESLLIREQKKNVLINDTCYFSNFKKKADLKLRISCVIIPIENNLAIIEKKSSALYEYCKILNTWAEENQFYINSEPLVNGILSLRELASGKKRIQQLDISNFFNLKEKYEYKIPFKLVSDEVLKKFKITKKFITINRGWDGAYSAHVKAWSLTSCRDLINRLKSEFPDYLIVAVGNSKVQAMDVSCADVDLIGKTDLEEIKCVLKQSSVHIDCEGGLVHLRHAINGGPSVVLFGPTNKDFFGYSENINLSNNPHECSSGCEWFRSNWQLVCTKTGTSESLCMKRITSQMVIEGVKEILNNR